MFTTGSSVHALSAAACGAIPHRRAGHRSLFEFRFRTSFAHFLLRHFRTMRLFSDHCPGHGFFGRLLLIILACTCAVSASAQVDLVNSRPTSADLWNETRECRRTNADVPRGAVGISDPHAYSSEVVNLLKRAEVKWVRAEFHWSLIEPLPGAGYRWGVYDRMVDLYRSAGIEVAGILTYIPRSIETDWDIVADRFERFAEAAARRYGPRGVHIWEVFNEPNLTGYGWLDPGTPPAEFFGAYTLLLARANKGIRRADPQGVVVLGGLANGTSRAVPAEQTMQAIYGWGARDCFDVFAFHPYGYQGRFDEARKRIDAIMQAAGDEDKPVWFNEYGWTDHRSMDININRTRRTNPMLMAFSQRHHADALFWFSARDHSLRLNQPRFGLVDYYLNERPSFRTFQLMQGWKFIE